MITGGHYQGILLLAVVFLMPACNPEVDVVPPSSPQDATPKQAASKRSSATELKSEGPSEAADASSAGHRNQLSKPATTQAISFDDIKFEMKTDDLFNRSMLTKKISDYEGEKIKIRGYILPSFKQDGLTQFVLVRDNMECCFGPGAALYDCVMVQMQSGTSASFSVRPVTVEGNFKIDEWKDFDGVIRAIYHLDGDSVY
ncbi:MAG: DUF3299 domain-containing protein [Pirellulales bacterium]|nr:DUF3299 domain-containing protein [Pirellulales bacterium]